MSDVEFCLALRRWYDRISLRELKSNEEYFDQITFDLGRLAGLDECSVYAEGELA